MNKVIKLENIPFTIEPVRVLREMRVSRIKSLEEIEEKPLADAIKKAIDKAYSLVHGRGVYKTFPLDRVDENCVYGEQTGALFTGANMVKLLAKCDYATLMACTIGPELEAEVELIQQDEDMTLAYALEMTGGWMADYMADRVDEKIDREIKKAGYGRTMRFSPGYGDWTLDNQPQLLSLVDVSQIGISLTESNIMTPRKSVSAVIGWERK